MFELLHLFAFLSSLLALTAAVIVFLRRRGKKNDSGHRSVELFLLGFLGVGILFYILGFLFGSHLACKGAQYAECTLGGLILVGPLSFSISTGVYLYFWGKNGKAP